MPAIITRGGLSAKGYGFGASAATGPVYVEDVFSTYIYTGTGATQTITNNINLSGKGGLVWIKCRNSAFQNQLFDTTRGAGYTLSSDATNAQSYSSDSLTSFTSTGFTLGADVSAGGAVNSSGLTYVSWTFRKQPKFFDIVSVTTGASGNTTIAHNLGVAPAMVILKPVAAAGSWPVYFSIWGGTQYVYLNTTDSRFTGSTWISASASSLTLTVTTPIAGSTQYIAYLFASNAGGFGSAGTDNAIACDVYSGAPGVVTVPTGFEPQFILKRTYQAASNWFIENNMTGLTATDTNNYVALKPNSTAAEGSPVGDANLNIYPSGFTDGNTTNNVFSLYIAIRRGPMKTPTDATKVFNPVVLSSSVTPGTFFTTGFPIDSQWQGLMDGSGLNAMVFNRLIGVSSTSTDAPGYYCVTSTLNAEATNNATRGWNNTGFQQSTYYTGVNAVEWNFGRAPGFFDSVCYTGTGNATTITHNLGVAPELIIVKERNGSTYGWPTGLTVLGWSNYLPGLSFTGAVQNSPSVWNSTAPTSSVFSIGTYSGVNTSGTKYESYLFATCPGVSKVGSYTGTGAAQNIDCGFSSSARFILIKRTSASGSWYVYDSARGISASNDPYLLLNSGAAQVTNTNYVGTYASGFALTSTAPADLNASGGTYIFLAIA